MIEGDRQMQIEPPPHTGLYSKYLQILTYSVLTSTPRGSHVYSHSPPGTEAWTSEGFSPGSPARESATLCHLLPRLSEAEGLSVSQMRGGLKEVKIGAEKEEGYRVSNRGLLERKPAGMA